MGVKGLPPEELGEGPDDILLILDTACFTY
jgi:hypothetical protein